MIVRLMIMTLPLIFISKCSSFCSRILISLLLVVELCLQIFVIAPAIFKNSILFYIYFVLLLFLMFNLLGNCMFLILTDTSVSVDNCTEPDLNVKLCTECDRNVPPRCIHCNNCKQCIPRRRAHCLLLGNCVGYFNHRYFFVSIVYSLLYSANTVAVETIFFEQIIITNIDLRMQMIGVYLENYNWAEFIFIYVFFISALINFFSLITSIFLLTSETDIILSGKLKNERGVEKYNNYNQGFRKNLICVLGKRWYLACFCPVIESQLPDMHIVLFPMSNKPTNSLRFYDYNSQ